MATFIGRDKADTLEATEVDQKLTVHLPWKAGDTHPVSNWSHGDGKENRKAIDWWLMPGEEVVAMLDGTVVYTTYDSVGTTAHAPVLGQIYIDHHNGYCSFYAHLDRVTKYGEGSNYLSTPVKAGEVIGKVGFYKDRNGVNAYHLHTAFYPKAGNSCANFKLTTEVEVNYFTANGVWDAAAARNNKLKPSLTSVNTYGGSVFDAFNAQPRFNDLPYHHPDYAFVEANVNAQLMFGTGGDSFGTGEPFSMMAAASVISREIENSNFISSVDEYVPLNIAPGSCLYPENENICPGHDYYQELLLLRDLQILPEQDSLCEGLEGCNLNVETYIVMLTRAADVLPTHRGIDFDDTPRCPFWTTTNWTHLNYPCGEEYWENVYWANKMFEDADMYLGAEIPGSPFRDLGGNGILTREYAAQLNVVILDKHSYIPKFLDIPWGSPYEGYALRGLEYDLFEGYEFGSGFRIFGSNGPAKKLDTIHMMLNTLGIRPYYTDGVTIYSNHPANLNSPDYHATRWASENGITNDVGEFNNEQELTKGELFSLYSRVLDLIGHGCNNNPSLLDSSSVFFDLNPYHPHAISGLCMYSMGIIHGYESPEGLRIGLDDPAGRAILLKVNDLALVSRVTIASQEDDDDQNDEFSTSSTLGVQDSVVLFTPSGDSEIYRIESDNPGEELKVVNRVYTANMSPRLRLHRSTDNGGHEVIQETTQETDSGVGITFVVEEGEEYFVEVTNDLEDVVDNVTSQLVVGNEEDFDSHGAHLPSNFEEPAAQDPVIDDHLIYNGQAISGEVNGAQVVPGLVGDALAFDGVDDFVRFSGVSLKGATAYTLEAWFKSCLPAQNGLNPRIVEAGSNPHNSTGIVVGNQGHNTGALFAWVHTAGYRSGSTNTPGPNNGEYTNYNDCNWHYVVSVYEASPNYNSSLLRLYVDGELVSTANAQGAVTSEDGILIGATNFANPSQFFNGVIDEVKITTSAKDSNVIGRDYRLLTEYMAQLNQAHLVYDGASLQGEVFGATPTIGGISGTSLYFDGIDDYITFGESVSLQGQNEFTIETWALSCDDTENEMSASRLITLGNSSANSTTIGIGNAQHNQGVLYAWTYIDGQRPFEIITPGPSAQGYTDYNDCRWHYYVLTKESNSLELYIDGQPYAGYNLSPAVQSPGGAMLGGGFEANNLFKGYLDETKIHLHGMSQDEILSNFESVVVPDTLPEVINLPDPDYYSGPAAYFNGQPIQGEVNGAYREDGLVGEAYYFDGDDYIKFSSEEVDLTGVDVFTLEAWVKPGLHNPADQTCYNSVNGENRRVIELGSNPLDSTSIVIGNQGPNVGSAYGWFYSGNVRKGQISSPTPNSQQYNSLYDCQWHHIAYIKSPSKVTLMVDGVVVSEQNATGTVTSPAGMLLGASGYDNPGQFFVGLIDEVHIKSEYTSPGQLAHKYTTTLESYGGQ